MDMESRLILIIFIKKLFETIYQIHGKQPLQNGGERSVEKPESAFHPGRFR
jgi:hypothetical protein